MDYKYIKHDEGIFTLATFMSRGVSEDLFLRLHEERLIIPGNIVLGTERVVVYTPLDLAVYMRVAEHRDAGISESDCIYKGKLYLVEVYSGPYRSALPGTPPTPYPDSWHHTVARRPRSKLLDHENLRSEMGVYAAGLEALLFTSRIPPHTIILPWGSVDCYREEDVRMLKYARWLLHERKVKPGVCREMVDSYALKYFFGKECE